MKINENQLMTPNNYFVYITTNPGKHVLYVGITNDLYVRMIQHYNNRGDKKSFAGKYYCYNLIYFERFDNPDHAIQREKELKGWRRSKKLELIKDQNPQWKFFNEEIKGW